MRMKQLIIAPVLVLQLIIFEGGEGRPGTRTDHLQKSSKRVARAGDYEDMEYDYDQNRVDENFILSQRSVLPPGLKISSGLAEEIVFNNSYREPPEYMMDLYNKFSRNHYNHPSSNIVRSFMNINAEGKTHD